MNGPSFDAPRGPSLTHRVGSPRSIGALRKVHSPWMLTVSDRARFAELQLWNTRAGLAPADRASFAWRLPSFDHHVGDHKQVMRRGDAERLGGLEIDGQLVLGWRLHRQVGWISALQNSVDVLGHK